MEVSTKLVVVSNCLIKVSNSAWWLHCADTGLLLFFRGAQSRLVAQR